MPNVPELSPTLVSAKKSHRKSSRLAAKVRSIAANAAASKVDNPVAPKIEVEDVASLYKKMELLLSQFSNINISDQTKKPLDEETAEESEPSTVGRRLSVGSNKSLFATSYTIAESKESEMCTSLFAPLNVVPTLSELRKALKANFLVKIPIHHYIYSMLKQKGVSEEVLSENFCIVEEVGNICPTLTPRVEAALAVGNAGKGTEAMQQQVVDVFLMGIMGTAQDHLKMDIRFDRNASEESLTVLEKRPDFLMIIDDQLVFKGEEKKTGNVRTIARELTEKMKKGSVGKKDSAIEYLLCYATAGSRVLFECIHDDNAMMECSNVIDLVRIPDRVSMLLILVNVIRIARALLNAKK
ncbi:hypothetical protein LPJ66_000325 [Kickxella alabastrina]|uniref:Uncharacterized protein n=1 Tax=Kickxella alabastrina TaxID=61397 RepID=A0ACC1IWC0_9FUNG|nr:hypothetical protein LPJ66_000325 [Kickxella alabastrina]